MAVRGCFFGFDVKDGLEKFDQSRDQAGSGQQHAGDPFHHVELDVADLGIHAQLQFAQVLPNRIEIALKRCHPALPLHAFARAVSARYSSMVRLRAWKIRLSSLQDKEIS